MPRIYVVYYLSRYSGLTFLSHVSMLVVLAPFSKSKMTVCRLPLGCFSPCQSLLGGSNPEVWILLPHYYCILASMRSSHVLITLLNTFA